MSRPRVPSMILAAAALTVAVPLSAQGRTAVTTSELEAAATARPAGTREAVRDFLAVAQVQRVAARMGIDLKDLSAGVATLDRAALDRFAAQSPAGTRDLAGGANVVISTTAIIIGLLILILLVG
jgi:hypothetical protein